MDERGIPPMSRTLRVGEALVLLLAVLVALVVGDHRAAGRDEQLSFSIPPTSFDTGATSADPELCWLLGVVADAQGRGAEVASQALAGGGGSCAAAAAQGANGQPLAP